MGQLPGLARVAILGDQDVPDAPSDPGWNPFERATDTAARTVGLQPQRLKVKGPTPDLDGAFGREQTPADLDTIGDLARVPDLLTARGYKPADIESIAHGNFLRFLREAWK